MVNVPSLIASVITAQGLGKEVRVSAVQDPTGGALVFNFYSPINIDGTVDLAS
jgi:ABC-type proline/glycine betaine transport system permease subunit